MKKLAFSGVVLGVLLTGCSGVNSPSEVPSSAGTTGAPESGLRGHPIFDMTCPTTSAPASVATSPAPPIRGTVRTIRICPPVSGTTQAPVDTSVDLTLAKDGAKFEALIAALSLPNDPAPGPGAVCPPVGLPKFEVLIDTTEGHWSPALPVNSCKFLVQPLATAVDAATG